MSMRIATNEITMHFFQWLALSFLTLKICMYIMMSKYIYLIALVPLRICSQSTLELVFDRLVQPCELLWVPTIDSHTLEYMVPHNMGTNDNSNIGRIANIPFRVVVPNCLSTIPKVVHKLNDF